MTFICVFINLQLFNFFFQKYVFHISAVENQSILFYCIKCHFQGFLKFAAKGLFVKEAKSLKKVNVKWNYEVQIL